jgi:hypothetical protein
MCATSYDAGLDLGLAAATAETRPPSVDVSERYPPDCSATVEPRMSDIDR